MSLSKKILRSIPLIFVTLLIPSIAIGQVAPTLSMRIAPPYFTTTLARGDVWSSVVKFSNGGALPIEVTARVVNFRGDGGEGIEFYTSRGTPQAGPYELASWVSIPRSTFTVEPGGTIVIPFRINVPEDAEPGGHYAGIVIGNDASLRSAPGASVTSALSALLLVRVSGEVRESGFIKDFFPTRFVTSEQAMTFVLDFKNTGNVHIEPKGEVVITNMYGRERGRITIEEERSFGHILPFSSKRFLFSWKGETNILDVGFYAARATLVYGDYGEHVAHHRAIFLVFPVLPVLGIFVFLYFFTFTMRRGVEMYVRRAVALAQKGEPHHAKGGNHHLSLQVLESPLRKGAREFLGVRHGTVQHRLRAYGVLFRKYRLFFAFIGVAVLGLVAIGYYMFQVFQSERAFLVDVDRTNRTGIAEEQWEE